MHYLCDFVYGLFLGVNFNDKFNSSIVVFVVVVVVVFFFEG